jgi:hypothetical protein
MGSSYAAAVLAAVPRKIWPDKPRGPGSVYAQNFLGEVREGLAVPVNATAEEYWNFGVLGVVFFSVLHGVLIRAAYYFLWRRYPDPFAVIFYILFLTGFRFDSRELVAFEQQAGLLFICYVATWMLMPKAASQTSGSWSGAPGLQSRIAGPSTP